MEPSGDPSNFEDWSVWRNFHEAGRLMTTHFHVFRSSLVYVLLPGSLISVVHFQILIQTILPGSMSIWLNVVVQQVVVFIVPQYASNKVFHAMKTTVYVLDAVKYKNGESSQVVSDLLTCRGDGYGGRRSQAIVVSIVCFLVYMLGLAVPVPFGFEGVAAVGMPEWTAFLFTPLLVAGMSLVNLYIFLVFTLVARLWMYAGQSTRPILV